MADLHSFLCAALPGWEKLHKKMDSAAADARQRRDDNAHAESLRTLQMRADKATAERCALEAERDLALHRSLSSLPISEAKAHLESACVIERHLVEQTGLRRIRDGIVSADMPPQAVAQALSIAALSSASGAAPPTLHLAAAPGAAPTVAPADAPMAPHVTTEDIDRLAMRFVTRVGTAGDPQERERLFTQWKLELYEQLPRFQASEIEQRARELLALVS